MPQKSRALATPQFALAVGLAALAGWVDATAYVRLSRTYVSFMSGNSTVLASAASAVTAPKAALLAAVLAAFVAGVILGEGAAMLAGRFGHAAALLLEALFLFAGALVLLVPGTLWVPAVLLSIALGIQNASVHQAAGMRLALTYVTGTLVRLGRRIAAALAGRGRWLDALPYLLLWTGMMVGAAAGAALTRASAALAIAVAGGVALLFAAAAAWARL